MPNLTSRCEGMLRKFTKAREGTLPVIFAVSIIPGLALLGMSLDFAGGQSEKSKLQAAADAAVMEALTASQRLEVEADTDADFVHNSAGYKPIAGAQSLFQTLASDSAGIRNISANIQVQRQGQKFSAKLNYSADYINRMPTVTGASTMKIEGMASSTLTTAGTGFLDIYTLLDTSSSMGVGASQSDMAALERWSGCAFSCHGDKPAGVMLRIDVMRNAVIDMINSAEIEFKKQPLGERPRIRVELNKFDHGYSTIEPLTSDYGRLRQDAQEIRLPWHHAGTNFKQAINWVNSRVTTSGNGQSVSSPRRFVFIVTDGMQDRGVGWPAINFPGPYGGDGRNGPPDPAACNGLKSKGITVAVLYTTHIGTAHHEWYWAAPQPAIRPNLKACASDGFFFEGSNAAELSSAFKKMFKRALMATNARLDK